MLLAATLAQTPSPQGSASSRRPRHAVEEAEDDMDTLFASGWAPAAAPGSTERLRIAQAIGTLTAADSGAPVRGPAQAATSAAPRDGAAAKGPDDPAWSIPPLRWGATTSTDIRADRVRATRAGNSVHRLQQYETANLRASSYVWQPWFAQVSGDLGLIIAKAQESDREGSGSAGGHRTGSSALTGGGDVSLFPASRFPFGANYSRSDSRASGDLVSSDVTSTRFGLRQSYRPVESGSSYVASFTRSTLESPSSGQDIVNALSAGMNMSTDLQSLDLTGSHTGNIRRRTGERTAFSQANARHSYRPEGEWSIDSLANLSSSEFRLLSGGTPSNNRSQFAQASSFATWRPEDDVPYYFSGGARMFRSAIDTGAGETQTLSLGGNIAATYTPSRQTNIAASATATHLQTDTASRSLTTQSVFANHTADPVGIWGASYAWNAGANASNQTGLAEGTRQNLGGQFGHTVTRGLTLEEGSQITLGIGQTAGAGFDSATSSAFSLGHNANASWRLFRSADTNAYVSLFGADTRTTGRLASHFQLVNFQLSGQLKFTGTSVLAANLTVQGVRQATGSNPSAGMPFNTVGTLSYTQQRAFNVPRLRYSAVYNAAESQFRSRLQGDVDAPLQRIDQSLEQRLDYNVGRVLMRLTMRLAQIEGRKDAMIFFRMSREFGGY